LVHEAYLRLVSVDVAVHWDSRGHFFAAAAEAMRRILIEHARRKVRLKHGGGLERVALERVAAPAHDSGYDLLSLDEALTKFAAVDPIKADLVKLRFFAGMTIPEAAEILHISHATAERYWTYARAWLFSELGGNNHAEGNSERT
jgi:RNA polymerase sigma factor (TIGR02999 family)